MKKLYPILFSSFFFLTFSIVASISYPAQTLSDFVLTVQVKNENCSSDGELTFEVSRTLPSAEVAYTIYLLPETNKPLRVQKERVLRNLSGGTYRIVATQTLNGVSSSKAVEATIIMEYQPMEFEIIAEDECRSNDGKITIDMLSGNASSYEIQGPVDSNPQSSNVFTGLQSGSYNIQVTNDCGERLSKSFEILKSHFSIDESKVDFVPLLPNCGEITVGHYIKTTGSTIQYPLRLDFTIFLPTGGQESVSTVAESGEEYEGYVYGTIPFFNNTNYTYDVSITDDCGNVSTSTNNNVSRSLEVSENMRWGAGPCGKRQLVISPLNYTAPYSINFISFPPGFDPTYNDIYPGPFEEEQAFFGDNDNPIPDGVYRFEVTDACGNSTDEIALNHVTSISRPSADIKAGCDVNNGSLQLLNYDYHLKAVKIVDAPTAFGQNLPYDVSQNIRSTDRRRFSMNQLPEGTYEFYTENDCGTNHSFQVEIKGHKIIKNEVEIVETCGSFNLNLDHDSNLTVDQPEKFGLQKLNPESGNWEHPGTGQVYVDGEDLNGANSVTLFNNSINYNFPFSGTFRVVKSIEIWRNGSEVMSGEQSLTFCLFPLKEFEIDTSIGFGGINVFSCSNELFDVAIVAKGYEPINYKITSKDGSPFLMDNGNDPMFKGLEQGLYAFQIDDRCGNILNKVFRVSQGNFPQIIPGNLCDGENGELSVSGLDFLIFEWWKEDDPSNILSTSSSLKFAPFDPQSDHGLYMVKLTHGDPNSCLNEILEFEIHADDDGPQAGVGATADLCEGEIINLFDFLEGPFDTYGRWEESTESNSLIGNFWTTTGLAEGAYEFTYTVPGLCNDIDKTSLTIHLFGRPEPPVGDAIQAFCAADSPTVADLVADGENVRWYLEADGGTALDETESLNDNTSYYSEQSIDGCPSISRLETKTSIEFIIENNKIDSNQALNRFEEPELLVGTIPTGGSGSYEFQWQRSSDNANWENIIGADQQNYQPLPLKGNIFFRRVVKGRCMDYPSNPVEITMKSVDLTITKTSFNKEIHDGEDFVYEIYLENKGLFDATEVVITDLLPPKVEYVAVEYYPSTSDIQVSASSNQGMVYLEMPLFPKGQSLNLLLTVTAIADGKIENTALVESREEDADPTNNAANDHNDILPYFIPNVIKPDFDHKNDNFIIRKTGKFEKVNLVIFNRWGDHVYESDDYQNDWSAEGLNSGTYYYIVRATDKFTKEHLYKGYIQVIK